MLQLGIEFVLKFLTHGPSHTALPYHLSRAPNFLWTSMGGPSRCRSDPTSQSDTTRFACCHLGLFIARKLQPRHQKSTWNLKFSVKTLISITLQGLSWFIKSLMAILRLELDFCYVPGSRGHGYFAALAHIIGEWTSVTDKNPKLRSRKGRLTVLSGL